MTNPLSCHLNVFVPDVRDERTADALAVIADAGFACVGLPPLVPQEALGEFGRKLAGRGLRPILFAVQRADADVSSADHEVRAAGRQALRDVLAAAIEVGADHITGVPYAAFGLAVPWAREARAWAAEAIAAFAEDARASGVTITLEVLNRYETSALNTAADARAFIVETGCSDVRLHLDGFHMLVEESDPFEAVVASVSELGLLEFGQAGRGALRPGPLDVGAIVSAAVAAGFDGPIAYEAFSRTVLPSSADRLRVWRDLDATGETLSRDAARFLQSAVVAGRSARSITQGAA